MSLAIDIDRIKKVCVAGHWYDVLWKDDDGEECSTFFFDAYEFVTNRGYEDKWPPRHLEHGGGDYDICAEGFQFIEDDTGNVISGPTTSIDAVMT
mgnify:CR=1 FL=1